jgi:hypothetical protein
MNALSILEQGRVFLDPVLEAHGFRFALTGAGPSSGGPFASAAYSRAGRRLEISFRWSLGDVTYAAAGLTIPHEFYMRAKLGHAGGNAYPGFSSDPLDGFRHLAHDLEHHCQEFLSGTDTEFATIAELALAPRPSGFKALS